MATAALRVSRPVPDDNPGYGGWKWQSDLCKVREDPEFTVFERDATLHIPKEDAQTGAWHRYSSAEENPRVFTRVYVVPTTPEPRMMSDFDLSMGEWGPRKSSWFSYKDVPKPRGSTRLAKSRSRGSLPAAPRSRSRSPSP